MEISLSEEVWIKVKSYHKSNKIISIIISLIMAYWTISYKKVAYAYYRVWIHAGNSEEKDAGVRQANLYNFILWLTFIYFAF